jgi:uroporphyrinogen III methyltransferase/synthase
MVQEDINRVLIEKAKEGKLICRLKGGDPFVFGRGGEEAEELAKEGLEFEVVPGISSAIAAPAYAGIPLTHRSYSSSLAIVPGYEDVTKGESSIDWARLAKGIGTIVFLMAVKNISQVCQQLIDNGRKPDTPVAVIRWGTRADQTTLVGNLSNITDLVKANEIKPPAVMVVGDVVKLRDSLKWYEKRPLFGQRVLVTREHTSGFDPLEELGAEVIEFRTIEMLPPEDWRELDLAIDKECDIRELKGVKICAVGSKTASAIKEYGIRVDLVPQQFNAEGLVEAFIKENGKEGSLKGLKILLPRAEIAREVFPEKVRELGGEIDVFTAYRTVKPEVHGKRLKRFLKEGKITIATFTSAATFNNFMAIMGEDAEHYLADVAIAAIGPVTASAVEKAGLKVSIMPEKATVDAMVSEIINWSTNR